MIVSVDDRWDNVVVQMDWLGMEVLESPPITVEMVLQVTSVVVLCPEVVGVEGVTLSVDVPEHVAL